MRTKINLQIVVYLFTFVMADPYGWANIALEPLVASAEIAPKNSAMAATRVTATKPMTNMQKHDDAVDVAGRVVAHLNLSGATDRATQFCDADLSQWKGYPANY